MQSYLTPTLAPPPHRKPHNLADRKDTAPAHTQSYLTPTLAPPPHRKPHNLATKVTHTSKQHAKLPFIKADRKDVAPAHMQSYLSSKLAPPTHRKPNNVADRKDIAPDHMQSYLTPTLAPPPHRKPHNLATKVTHTSKQHAKLPFIKASTASQSQATQSSNKGNTHILTTCKATFHQSEHRLSIASLTT